MACVECELALFPQGPRQHEGHFAVRFGDTAIRGVRVLLDGLDVTDDTFEAVAGEEGKVYVYDRDAEGRLYRCHCGQGVESRVLTGQVAVEVNAPTG